jgi:DNA repair photolyase
MTDMNEIPIASAHRRGRGATSNRTGRFEPASSVRVDDGWNQQKVAVKKILTKVTIERPVRIITRNKSPDVPFDQSINAYRGCEHGCIYCFARPTHAFMNLSPGLDFETNLFAKPDAADLLENELCRPSYKCSPIAMGTNTDPYQPIEQRYRITRNVLKVLQSANHPVTITTKSASIVNDLDILANMAEKKLVSVGISVTTLNHRLSRKMEPRASTPRKRLDTIKTLSDAGVPTVAQFAPVIPGLNDSEMEEILEQAKQAGAVGAAYILLRLPLEVAGLFTEWLEEHYPDRAGKVLKLVQSTRGGKMNDSNFKQRMIGTGPYAAMINRRFALACRHLKLNKRKYDLRTDLFSVPERIGDQLDLF